MRSARIIQAGMGIGISNWVLANAVASEGQIGVVSGTALDTVLVRRLQDGDLGGHIRSAMFHFPDPDFSNLILKKYFLSEGRPTGAPYHTLPLLTAHLNFERQKLLVLANFVEVFLAKRGHGGMIGINYLEKIQFPVLPSLYGAMLAGVDYVLMGAGIPREIPLTLNKLSRHEDTNYKLNVSGAGPSDNFKLSFSPKGLLKNTSESLHRPYFLGIVSSTVLAITLTKKVIPSVDGLVIESFTAGGHNAPPRGKFQYNERGEPVYGEKDQVDLATIAALGVPFWLAGARGSYQSLQDALNSGATGIQVGTAFALCQESGLKQSLKDQIIGKVIREQLDVFTDPLASPTGFPFKLARLKNTNSEKNIYEARKRRCDLGYLRESYKKDDGSIAYKCPAEPVEQFVKKGGTHEQTVGKKCLCNGLFANIGFPQFVNDAEENPLITIGDDIKNIRQFLRNDSKTFTAKDVLRILLGTQ